MSFKLLVINPGSTSIKMAVFEDCSAMVNEKKEHDGEGLCVLPGSGCQLKLRFDAVESFLKENKLSIYDFDAIVSRGGLIRPVASGTYFVSQKMVDELAVNKYGWHAANDGAIIAWQLANRGGIPAYIVDPVVVDELSDVARVTGRPDMEKKSIFHALNQKAVAKRYAKANNKEYHDMTLVVAHMGGGISVGCHHKGRVIEVNNALNGEGPFSPNRMGTVQARAFVELVYKHNWGLDEISEILMGKSGVLAHLGTEDMIEVEKRVDSGDEKAHLILEAMAYQVGRYIAANAVAAKGLVQQIILTGGIANSKKITDKITSYVNFIAPVTVSPGEDEMQALAEGAVRVLTGEEEAFEY